MKYSYRTGIIAGMLAVSSVVSFASGKNKFVLMPLNSEPSVIENEERYDFDTISKLVVVNCYNKHLNKTQLFIAEKVYTKYADGRGFYYIDFFLNNILSNDEFDFIDDEPLSSYLNDFNSYYTKTDLYKLYADILSVNNIRESSARKLQKTF